MELKIKSRTEVFTHQVSGDTVSIGRSSDNDFVIPIPDFSRKHCLITFQGPYAFIMDLGSKNGVMIDGKRIPPNEQYPIYESTRVTLANYFDFLLPNSLFIELDSSAPRSLEEIIESRKK